VSGIICLAFFLGGFAAVGMSAACSEKVPETQEERTKNVGKAYMLAFIGSLALLVAGVVFGVSTSPIGS
jgi:predicted nucleic acid-binding Zn ribbon protein